MGPDLWELFEYGEADDEVAAIIRLGHYAAVPPGVRVIAQFEDIVTVRLSRRDIPKISSAAEVDGMSAGDTYLGADLELESAEALGLPPTSEVPSDTRRPEGLGMTGRGIIIGCIDWGFDFAHPQLRRDDGSTRIVALWDQRGGKRPDSPQPYGYGVVHTREAINEALKTKDPYAALNYHPADADTGIGCHATHVISIAAGSATDTGPTGIAPEADLVLVHNAPFDGLEEGRLGDSVTVLEGIQFISQTAAGRPWVINLSMGRHGEQHDGSTLVELGLDASVRSVPGRAIVLSTGNYYNKQIHASGQLRPTEERTFSWVINEDAPSDYNQLEVWYSWQDRFEVTVRSPDGSISARTQLGEKVKLLSGGKEIGNIYHRAQEPNTLDHHITLFLYKSAPAGEWDVTISGIDVISGDYHAWIEREVSCPACQSHFRPEDADSRSTTGTICNGRRTLAVGAYSTHDAEQRLAPFSSVGPTRDGRLKPDLCAPGVSVLAARSAARSGTVPLLTRMSGTSMAAPHVTGTVALMFQASVKPLRIEETHNLLLGSARRVNVPEDNPQRIGIGFLDIEAAVEAAASADHSGRTFKPLAAQAAASAPAAPSPTARAPTAPARAAPAASSRPAAAKPAAVRPAAARPAPARPAAARPAIARIASRSESGERFGSVRSEPGERFGSVRSDTDRTEKVGSGERSGEGIGAPEAATLATKALPIDIAEGAEAEHPTMRSGSSGDAVRETQQKLDALPAHSESAEGLAPSTLALALALADPLAALSGSGEAVPGGTARAVPRPRRPLTSAEIYDALVSDPQGPAGLRVGQYLEVVAAPRTPLVRPLKAGDVMVQRGPGDFAHEAIIASPRLQSAVAKRTGGAMPEARVPGHYAEVFEGGRIAQMRTQVRGSPVVRRVTDGAGNVPPNTLIVRPVRLTPGERLDPLSLLLGMQFANTARPPPPQPAAAAPAPPDPVTQDEL
jgi:subtilisin family serine protease